MISSQPLRSNGFQFQWGQLYRTLPLRRRLWIRWNLRNWCKRQRVCFGTLTRCSLKNSLRYSHKWLVCSPSPLRIPRKPPTRRITRDSTWFRRISVSASATWILMSLILKVLENNVVWKQPWLRMKMGVHAWRPEFFGIRIFENGPMEDHYAWSKRICDTLKLPCFFADKHCFSFNCFVFVCEIV